MSDNYSIHHNLRLVSTAGNYAAGTCLCKTTAGDYVIATSANRTTYGPSTGIMRTAGDGTRNRAVDVQFCGLIPASVAGVGAGTEGQWVRVSSAGFLERVTSPGAGDDVVGKADAAGNVKCLFGGLLSTGGAPAGGTGAVQYNNAGSFAAIAPNAAFGKPLVSNGSGAPPIYDSISLANNAAIVAPGAANELLVNDGTGAVSYADEVRAGANYLSIGTNPATTGAARLANNTGIFARNAANSANVQLGLVDSSNNVIIGAVGNPGDVGVHVASGRAIYHQVNGVACLTIDGTTADFGSQKVATTGSVAIGSAPATGGQLRLTGNTSTDYLKIRFSGTDYSFLNTDGSNNVQWGNSTFNYYLYGYTTQVWGLTGTLTLYGQSVLGATFGSTGVQFGTGATDHGGGTGVIGVDNAATDPTTNPTGGGILYASGGAGKWRGSSGTVTTFGPAEPHCPRCGTDVGISQSENDLFGEELVHCPACEIRTGNGVVRHVADFFERRKAA